MCLFQSTRPRGARRKPVGRRSCGDCFNPRAHAGRDFRNRSLISLPLFQSTRPRGARPKIVGGTTPSMVSIHAPTRGATEKTALLRLTKCFNPRAHAGRDCFSSSSSRESRFQSTRPRGARHAIKIMFFGMFVSIHAPTRGATSSHPNDFSNCGFNPRAHAGRDVAGTVG